jgi:formate-dependent nitrite reductase membrane component NrfD
MTEYKLLLGFKPQEEWADKIMWLEMSLGAIGGGLFMTAAIAGDIRLTILGFLILMAGKGMLLLVDLGQPARFYRVLARPFGSWISLGAWAMLIFGAAGGLFCLLSWLSMNDGGLFALIRIIALLAALILICYDGLFLSASTGIFAWTTGMLAPLFAFSALASGCGLLLLFGYFDIHLIHATLAVHVALVACVAVHLAVLGSGPQGAQKTRDLLLHGDFKNAFVYGVILGSIVLPLVLLLVQFFGVQLPNTGYRIIGILAVSGVFPLRYSLLRSGVRSPVIADI